MISIGHMRGQFIKARILRHIAPAIPHGRSQTGKAPPRRAAAPTGLRRHGRERHESTASWACLRGRMARQIGAEPDELDAALYARPVPARAAERLAAWAAAG